MKHAFIIIALALACANAALLVHPAFAGGPQANLSIAIQAPNSPVIAGAQAQYQVTTTNQGPAQAVNVETTFSLPAGAGFVSVTPSSGCGYASGIVTCTRATLDVNQSTTFAVVVSIAPDARGTLLWSGATRSNIADPDPNNNNRVVSTSVQPEIDLQLTLDDVAPNPPIAGAPLLYQFRVDNNGRSTASNTIVQLNLPADSIEPTLTASSNMQCVLAQAGVTCDLGIVAPAGITQTTWLASGSVITVEVQPKASLAAGSSLSMSASIDGEELEAATGNNFVSRADAVARLADLALQAEDVDALIMSGNEATFTFVARNNGPSNDDQVVFEGQFAANVFEVQDVTGPDCTHESGTLTCALGTLAPGQQAMIVVRGIARAVQPTALEFAAALRGATPEEQTGATNTATQTVQIQPHMVYMPSILR